MNAGGVTALVLSWCLAVPDLVAAQTGAAPGHEVLLERTLALVGGAVITQSDVDLARALGLIDDVAGPRDPSPLVRLIDRQLMLREVARFSPPEPTPAAVQARMAAVHARAGGPAAVAAALTRAGTTPARLESWVRDDLRVADYVDQRFASAGTPSDAEVAAYLRTHGDALAAAGVAPDDLTTAARQRVVEERRRGLITDWLVDLRRRTEVVEFKD